MLLAEKAKSTPKATARASTPCKRPAWGRARGGRVEKNPTAHPPKFFWLKKPKKKAGTFALSATRPSLRKRQARPRACGACRSHVAPLAPAVGGQIVSIVFAEKAQTLYTLCRCLFCTHVTRVDVSL